ncbi:MAG: amidohydrolase [Actinomycetia bacterium]|nr:amidohydrolase [Actinomycetes bacterium]
MFNGHPVLDVHAHVSHPMAGMGQLYMFMQATNEAIESPINTAQAAQFGLDDEAFAVTVASHLAYIDERDIDVQVLGPRPFLMLADMADYLLPAWTRAINDTIAKQVSMHPDRFLGACQLPQDIHAPDSSHLLPELRRCVDDLGFVGVYLSPDPEGRHDAPGLAEPWYDALYAECEARGLPIIVHGTNCRDPRFKHVPFNYQLGFVAEQYWANQVLSHSDVFDRFPGLKVLICHCGGALDRWMPNDPHLSHRDLTDNLFYDTCAHDELYLECAIKQRGAERMVFGTEAPGSGSTVRLGDGPSKTADDLVPIVGGFDFLSDAQKLTIFQANPERLFPAMARLAQDRCATV